mgnify:CR=1 FL=1
MNLKKNFFIFYILFNILVLSIVNLKNTNKININIFTWQSSNLSIGNIVTYSYFAGISINALLTLLILSSENRLNEDINEKELSDFNEEEDEVTFNEVITERPPERDLKDSQPTISVNYRVVETNNVITNKRYNEQNRKNSSDNISEDWEENNADW